MNLPEKYIKNMKDLLGDEFNHYIQMFDEPRSYGLRINTNKISVEDFLKISPFNLEPIPWTTNGFYYSEDQRPAKHPYYYAGLYYLQEPSAMTPAQVLPIQENDFVLDTCAAPGGKSTELAAKLNNTGLLITNDISASRAQALLKNIELFGIENSYVISEDLVKLEKNFQECFDKILIDAPCSGEGMFRKESGLIKSWEERGNEYYVSIQKQICKSALNMLKPGGMLVYSTCTFAISEDEEVISYMKECCPNIKILPIQVASFFEKGKEINGDKDLSNCIRLYPHKIKGEGHFVALIQKGEINTNSTVKKKKKVRIPLDDEFFKLLKKDFYDGEFEIKKDKLYFIPHNELNLKGVRILRSGLLLGECKKNHFEPSQSLALALKMNEFQNIINLSSEDIRTIKYLKGETLDISDISKTIKGWTLVCVDGYPLGFAKCQNGSLKNKYAQGWRWQ